MSVLYIGSHDSGKRPASRTAYLNPYHIDGILIGKVSFRDDDRTKWRSFREVEGNHVLELQTFLHAAGFMPRCVFDGIFGYVTQAAIRLFQEYVRTVENQPNMIPDGIVGRGTKAQIARWKTNKTSCRWGTISSNNPTEHYKEWLKLLEKAKTHYNANPTSYLKVLNNLSNTYGSKKVTDWSLNKNDIHLIGIRRNEDESETNTIRKNDDLFFLLMNGMVFTFWGSTDPSGILAERPDEPFLVEGQHLYRFGWHKITKEKKIYRALKPQHKEGVMVIRDWKNDNTLTDEDFIKPLEANNSINIHWSGIGSSNFSAGCQVIAGKSYLNDNNNFQDCSKFASRSYGALTDSLKKTKGAYNVFTDLILCYAPDGITHLRCTLLRASALNLSHNFGSQYIENIIAKLKLE